MPSFSPVLKWWPIFALIASATMLAIAHAFESFGGLAPCHLCLKQREAYWAAIAVAGLGAALAFTPWERRGTRIVSALLILVFLYGAGYAVYHAGAEWKFWPGPQSCSGAATHVSAADLSAVLKGARSAAPPACDQAAWVFLGLSMAGWNAVISLGLAAASGLAVLRKPAA